MRMPAATPAVLRTLERAFWSHELKRVVQSYFARHPRAAKYRDYRRMLAEMDGQIDAVVVSAPNHVHAPASVMAMRLKKHVLRLTLPVSPRALFWRI